MRPFATLLVVETNPISAFLYQRALQRFAVAQQVLLAPTPTQALSMLASAGPEESHLLPELLVVGMRPADCLAFLAAYQRLPAAQRHVPVVVLVMPGARNFRNEELEQLQRVPIAGLVELPLTTEKARQLLSLRPPRRVV